jgi:hypothetical protein
MTCTTSRDHRLGREVEKSESCGGCFVPSCRGHALHSEVPAFADRSQLVVFRNLTKLLQWFDAEVMPRWCHENPKMWILSKIGKFRCHMQPYAAICRNSDEWKIWSLNLPGFPCSSSRIRTRSCPRRTADLSKEKSHPTPRGCLGLWGRKCESLELC